MKQTERLRVLGFLVRAVRSDRRVSVEKVSADAGIGHMTYRRIEAGKAVRMSTLGALDSYFGLPAGTLYSYTIGDIDVGLIRDALGLPEALTGRAEGSAEQVSFGAGERRLGLDSEGVDVGVDRRADIGADAHGRNIHVVHDVLDRELYRRFERMHSRPSDLVLDRLEEIVELLRSIESQRGEAQ